MSLATIKLFCDVAQHGNFSKGAELHGITQSAASQRIRGLEDDLGVELIDRSTRPCGLTHVGKVYYEGCREILDRYDFGSSKDGTILVAFLPLLLATGANVGGQASALVLRGLTVQSLSHGDMRQVVWKEARVGLLLCATLGSVVFGLTWIFTRAVRPIIKKCQMC